MVFREVSVIEICEVLRAWLVGKSERAVAEQPALTARRANGMWMLRWRPGCPGREARSSSPMS